MESSNETKPRNAIKTWGSFKFLPILDEQLQQLAVIFTQTKRNELFCLSTEGCLIADLPSDSEYDILAVTFAAYLDWNTNRLHVDSNAILICLSVIYPSSCLSFKVHLCMNGHMDSGW